ncbi:MAG: hypothetical protein U0361_19745 [Nitrospiraceae bacterium]
MTSKRPWCSNIGRLPALLLLTTFWSIASVAAPAVEMEVVVREGCPRCSAADAVLAGLTGKRPELLVQYRDVGRDPPMLARLRQLAAERHISQVGLPAFFIRDRLIVGYQDEVSTGARLLELLDHVTNEAMPNKVEACRVEPREGCAAPADADQGIHCPGSAGPRYETSDSRCLRSPSGYSTASILVPCGCCCFSSRSWSRFGADTPWPWWRVRSWWSAGWFILLSWRRG